MMTPKRIIQIATLLTVVLVALQSCYDNATLVIDNSPAINRPVTFSNDVVPLLVKSCTMSGCHNAGGQAPDLTATKAYASLINGSFINTASPNQSTLYLYLTGKKTPAMPLGAAPNPSNINQYVLAWIQQGAKNN